MPATATMTAPTIPPPSALTTLISSSDPPATPSSASTLQILHNLQHQHLWTSLQVHELDIPNQSSPSQYLISGIPPHRLYTHPDEQLYMLTRGLRETDIELERVYVLPSVRGQSWTLARLAGVFDALPAASGEADEGDAQVRDSEAEVGEGEDEERENGSGEVSEEKLAKLKEYYAYRRKARKTEEWGGKRILLAMVDRGMGGDGTVVYYVVQEGAVKPRQN